MRVILGLAMLASACQNIDPETPTPAVVVPPPVIDPTQVTPATPLIEAGTLTSVVGTGDAPATVDAYCCPLSFGVGEVSYSGTALTEKWFVDLQLNSSTMQWTSSSVDPNNEVQLTPVLDDPGVWTDGQVTAAPYPFDPASFPMGPHTVQVFVSNAFANPDPTSSEPPYEPAADGGTVTSQTWVVLIGTCTNSTMCASTSP